ncbi:MAG: sigma-70 family RNA polymerase sigma factor [Planctomycetes bacterium]|nr:sigma-70 family RNA polymerase sigma factor [Planctomycetota bacterium]
MPDSADRQRLSILLASRSQFLAFVERRIGSREEAEEVLQDAFASSVEHVEGVRDEDSIVAWFYRVLRNAIVDWHRRRARELPGLEDDSDLLQAPPDTALQRDLCVCIEGLLPLIHPDYAELVRLVDLEGRSVGAVAKDRGVSAGSARVRLHRARAALRREVQLTCRTCAEHGCLDCTCARPSGA